MRGTGEDGQALVEAALVLPLVVATLLCGIQLMRLQQARLLAEYAAFCAARAGIVFDGNNGQGPTGRDGPLHDAAALALMPLHGRSDSFERWLTVLARRPADTALASAGLSEVEVLVLNPRRADFASFGQHLDQKEIDFDDVRPAATRATLLSLELRCLVELQIPLANWLLFRGWATAQHLGGQADPRLPALEGLAGRSRFFVPVTAHYTMRMQSNPFVRWAHP